MINLIKTIKNKISNSSLIQLLEIISQTNHKIKKNIIFTIFLVVISGFLEMIMLSRVNSFFRFESGQLIAIKEIIIIIFAAVFTSIFKIIATSYIFKSAGLIANDIVSKIYKNYLYKEINSYEKKSEINARILGFQESIGKSSQYFLSLCYSIITSSFLIIALLFISPRISIFTGIILFSCYVLIAFIIRPILEKNSKTIFENIKSQSEILTETSGFIKEIKNWKFEKKYYSNFSNQNKKLRLKMANNDFLITIPRYIIELIILFILVGIFLISSNKVNIFATIATLGIAAQRLIPSIQVINNTLAGIQGYKFQLIDIKEYIKVNLKDYYPSRNSIKSPRIKPVKIIAEEIRYLNPNENNYVLNNLSFLIDYNNKVLIKGASGCGKSTLLDILCGLKSNSSGKLDYFIEDKKINLLDKKFFASWMPQYPSIANKSLGFNITFEEDESKWDFSKLEFAKKVARVNFVNSINNKSENLTFISGDRLSGGQIQRIGIARTIYMNMGLMLFDEPTSSIDKDTSEAILKDIEKYCHDSTIILVSHKENNSITFDKVVRLDEL